MSFKPVTMFSSMLAEIVYTNHVTTAARHSEINDVLLGQYRTRSGRSVDTAF